MGQFWVTFPWLCGVLVAAQVKGEKTGRCPPTFPVLPHTSPDIPSSHVLFFFRNTEQASFPTLSPSSPATTRHVPPTSRPHQAPLVGILPTCRLVAPGGRVCPFLFQTDLTGRQELGDQHPGAGKEGTSCGFFSQGFLTRKKRQAFCSRKLHGKNTFHHGGSLCPQIERFPVVDVGAVAP